jgi:hypothetical protein
MNCSEVMEGAEEGGHVIEGDLDHPSIGYRVLTYTLQSRTPHTGLDLAHQQYYYEYSNSVCHKYT